MQYVYLGLAALVALLFVYKKATNAKKPMNTLVLKRNKRDEFSYLFY